MSARILVVDDILPNVKLLEAKLAGEYFDVITATSGQEALEKVESEGPDIILLDIMMPGMDGFEVCERLKANPATAHIPVVMVTALTDATDRVRGLEAGADDFLSKPVNDIALMARVRSLVRLKMTVDEWRIRENTASQFGLTEDDNPMSQKVENATILVVEDKAFESAKFVETLKRDDDVIDAVDNGAEAIRLSSEKDYDLIVISLDMEREDGLRLCSHLRSNERTRSVPILMLAEESEMRRIAQGLDIGAHDYILRPVDRNEFLARVRTQIRRKRFQDRLRANYETSLSMAMMDPLTGLFNRRYLMAHFENMLRRNAESKKTMGVLMFDLDHFKAVNDTYGHQAGDEVLKAFAERVSQRLRSFDLVARMGGEEFVAVLPDISRDVLMQVAERLRKSICNEPVKISEDPGQLDVSTSIGAVLLSEYIQPEEALRIADEMLYAAKEAGRNCVFFEGVGRVTQSDDRDARAEQIKQLSQGSAPVPEPEPQASSEPQAALEANAAAGASVVQSPAEPPQAMPAEPPQAMPAEPPQAMPDVSQPAAPSPVPEPVPSTVPPPVEQSPAEQPVTQQPVAQQAPVSHVPEAQGGVPQSEPEVPVTEAPVTEAMTQQPGMRSDQGQGQNVPSVPQAAVQPSLPEVGPARPVDTPVQPAQVQSPQPQPQPQTVQQTKAVNPEASINASSQAVPPPPPQPQSQPQQQQQQQAPSQSADPFAVAPSAHPGGEPVAPVPEQEHSAGPFAPSEPVAQVPPPVAGEGRQTQVGAAPQDVDPPAREPATESESESTGETQKTF